MAKKSVIVSLEKDMKLMDETIELLDTHGHKIIGGKLTVENYEDNETCPFFDTSVRGRRVFIISSPNTAEKILQLEFTIDAARRAGAADIVPIVTYFPYARQDKKDHPRGPIGGKVRAFVLEALGATTVVTFDLHADQIQGFFQIPVIHMDGKYIFTPEIKRRGLEDVVLVSPDAGGGKRVKHYRDLILRKYGIDLPIVFMDKTRLKANEIAKMQIIGDVRNKHAIIIDDMCDTAGTLCTGAKVLMEEGGAESVKAIVTHGVLSGPAYQRINDSVLDEFICANTLPVDTENNPKITTVTIANQIMMAVIAVDKGKSIEELKENEFKWE